MRRLALIIVGLLALAGVAVASSGRETLIAAALVYERSGDVYTMSLDGTSIQGLTSTSAWEGNPAVSEDGSRIAYERAAKFGVRHQVWLMNVDGGKQRRLLPAGGKPSDRWAGTGDPSWSPDGRTIVVARSSLTPNDICGSLYLVDASGSVLRRITADVELHYDPAVSPDGGRIAFVAGECEPGLFNEPRVITMAGRKTSDLRKLRGFDFFDPSWSPDGRFLAFEVGGVEGAPPVVYIVQRDGAGLRRVTPRGLYAEDPAWSPDGTWIAFAASSRSRSKDLYIVHPDGTGLRRLTQTKAKEHSPAWIRE